MTGRKEMAVGLALGAALGLLARQRQAVGGLIRRLFAAARGRFSAHAPSATAHAGAAATVAFPDAELIRQCVHCGLCLPYCPTYRALGLEADSPRGRIYQMKLVAQGKIDPADPHFRQHISRCLDCRACETACPSGVQYGRLVEAARSLIPPAGRAERMARRVLLAGLLDSPRLLAMAGAGARLYQRSGLQMLVRGSGALRLAPALRRMDAMLPQLRGALLAGPLPPFVPAQGERRCRVGFLRGCVAAEFFPETNHSTIAVLAANGCDVFTPPEQGCCGALQNHSGDRETAKALARRNIDVFERLDLDYVVANAAGCGSMMKEYGALLADDPAYAARAAAFAARVRDVCELLAALPLRPPRHEVRRRAAYQDACHLGHGQKVREAPRQVLRAIPGLQLVELREADWCCGSAGIYNLAQPQLSAQILAWKMANVARSGADTLAVANPGCHLQIAYGLRERGLRMRVAHPVDLLAEAYGLAPGADRR